MCQVILYMCVYFTTELWRVFSVFFMDNFHGKRVDNMHRSKDRKGGFFPHMETWIHVSVYMEIIGVHNCTVEEEETVSELIKHGQLPSFI